MTRNGMQDGKVQRDTEPASARRTSWDRNEEETTLKLLYTSMDDHTSIVLALQLVALACIACALLLYLLKRIRPQPAGLQTKEALQAADPEDVLTGRAAGRSVLITCCDTSLGLQLAMHLSNVGFRVFAGLRTAPAAAQGQQPPGPGQDVAVNAEATVGDSLCARLLRAHAKHQEAVFGDLPYQGSLVILPMDVTREDVLHDAMDVIRRHLPAGHDGLHAVINTAGLCSRGRLELQENSHWDAMLKVNVVGAFRTARTFLPLLRNNKGRLLNVGAPGALSGAAAGPGAGAGAVAYTAARYAVEGATSALRTEMEPLGVSVISLQPPEGTAGEALFLPPREGVEHHDVLGSSALRAVEEALLCEKPKPRYQLRERVGLLRAVIGGSRA
ncbi:D-beta-hydroxybutyrate dehydrogenase, mitochondrial [Frankliniella fusca]|uniref:D-beta-hydroxybutyrate dehydrogenase, mitochondrial n=1 Tax=Frankliniella fusca TaxID=407009 RepID=A0AAE1LR05_9NEOP|nr:D-beta-hydroxybutyrate dehydrogenase, mitochondrial [Frankliniella fusca]